MDFRQLEMFHAVAENASFTLAGEQLHVAQSAISRKVKLLEEELGQRLFRRASKRVFLTPAGELLLRYTRRIFQELRNAALDVSSIAGTTQGTIRIGSGMTACMFLLPPILEKFQARFPDIDIKVVTGPTEVLIPQIQNSVLDLGVLTLPIVSPGLEIVPFTTEEMVVVTSPRHAFAKRRSLRLEEVAAHPMILHPRDSATRQLIDRCLQQAGVIPKVAMEAETVATIKPLVRINLGIGFLPLRAVAAEARRGELHYLHVRGTPLNRQIGVVYQKSDFLPRPLKHLVELFTRSR
jgi:DNA-binding transcriptional LysR family regulator